MEKKNYFLFVLFMLSTLLSAQTGPGGIGNSDGSNGQPENLIWLDASELSSFSDGAVWPDKSGNNNNATHIDMGGNFPTISLLNGLNTLSFDGSASYLRILDDGLGANRLDGMSKLAIFAVSNPGSNDVRALISKRLGSGGSVRSWSLFHNSGYKPYGYSGSTSVGDGVSTQGAFGITTYIADGNLSLYYNGALQVSGGSSVSIPDRSENICIGRFDESVSEARWYSGSIAELIVIREGINTAQKNIIESYLNTKWGIGLVSSLYNPTNASFIQDVAGIGVEADGANALANSDGLYLSVTDHANGDYVIGGHDNTINDIANINTSLDVQASGAQAAWNRAWYVEQTGTPTVRLSFDLSEGIGGKFPQDISNYVLLYKSTPTGNYSQVTTSLIGVEVGDRIYFEVSDADFTNGYYTLGTLDQVLSPVEGGDRRIWYTLRSTADWNSPDSWTLEPCGCLPNNPDGYTPITSPTGPSDKVVILSGKKITVPAGVNNLINSELEVDGELDLQSTNGHAFATIKGRGQITMSADNFPTGDAYDFIAAGEGEGKVVYQGGGYNISSNQEFFDVDIELDDPGNEINLLADLTVNGSLKIEKGSLSISDDVATTNLNIEVTADLYISSAGKLLTGGISGSSINTRHELNLYGDFTNEGGEARFTQRTTPIYNSEATDGITDVNFLSDNKDQVATCNGITNFYRIEIDKGVDKTYVVSINASSTANFGLYGCASYHHGSISQLTTNDNALGLLKGTVRLGQNVTIGQLNTGSNYNISEAARLWIDGGDVTKSSGTAIVPYGEVRVSEGVLSANVNSGITLRDNGIIRVEGGVLNVYQIRTSTLGSEHQGGYVQSGGVTNVTANTSSPDYYPFNLTYEGNSFQMTGGVLNIERANGKGGIFINSIPANYNVTGGTVNLNIGSSNDFVITSRAPFYNLNLKKSASNSNVFVLNDGVDVGTTDVDLVAQPLKVLNDFRIWGEESGGVGYEDITLDAATDVTNINDVYVGGSLYFEEGVTYNCRIDDDNQNTTYFNQTAGTSAIDSLYWGHSGGGDNKYGNNERLELAHFVLDRTSGNELRTVGASNIKNNQIMIDVNGDASVLSGTLDQGRMTFRTYGKIVNYDRMGTWYEDGSYPVNNGTPSTAQIRFREDPPVEIITTDGAVFGNIRFNVNPNQAHVELTSDVKIERLEFMRGVVYLGEHQLTIDNMWNMISNNHSSDAYFKANSSEIVVTDEGVSDNKIFYTDGKSSDGGLRLYIGQNTPTEVTGKNKTIDDNTAPLTFPIGFTTNGDAAFDSRTIYHRPAQVKVKDFQDDGYIAIRPVSGELKTTNSSGSSEVLQHYWRVNHSDFTNVPTVALRFYYQDKNDVLNLDKAAGATMEASYVPGYVLDEAPYTRRYESDDVDGTPASPVSDFTDVVNTGSAGVTRVLVFNGTSSNGEYTQAGFAGFPLINANFTCGEVGRFSGAPDIFYSRIESFSWYGRYWEDVNNWSMVPHDGASNNAARPAAGDWPQVGDIAVIGYGGYDSGTGQHSITIRDGKSIEVAEIIFSNHNSNRLVIDGNSSLEFGRISGTGGTFMQRIKVSEVQNINGDFGDFYSNNSFTYSYFLDEGGEYALNPPTTKFPSLRIEGGSNRTAVFDKDITVNNRMTVDGSTRLKTSNGADGNITVKGQLRIGGYQGGELLFNNGAAKSVEVGEIWMNGSSGSSSINVLNDVANGIEHRLIVNGNINQAMAGDFNLFNGNDANDNNVILELNGEGQHSYRRTAGNEPNLYRLVINKGDTQENTFSIDNKVTVSGTTLGAGVKKAIELQNGVLILNDTGIEFNLTTGNDNFEINATSGLEISQGKAYANGNSGISLDGLLKISGGTLDMSGGDNPIIYSVSGNAEIEISEAASQLLVGSQIRRPASDDLGVLKYTQSEGDVQIGVSSGGLANRAMLEVLNTGSLFSHTGGTLSIVRQNTSTPTTAALYFEPSSYSTEGSTINIFNGSTPASGQNAFRINSSIPFNDLTINGTNNPVAEVYVRPLQVNGVFEIKSGATLDAKGLDMYLQGNLTNEGTFSHSNNEVFFIGSVPQIINGETTFYKLTKNTGADVLSLNAGTSITVDNLLTLSSGSFDTGNDTVFVNKDIINDGIFLSSGNGSVALKGITEQQLSGNGQFDKLHLDNTMGFVQLEGNELTINKNLQMEDGIFDIGKNLIVFNKEATINSNAGYSASNMIQTNISFVDAGIKKFLPQNAVSFTYPLGSGNVYTPVHLNITQNSSTEAFVRVKGAKEVHPSVIDDAGTVMNERDNVLAYYWVLDTDELVDFMGSIEMEYPFSLVQTEPAYDYADYITARLLSRGVGDWNKDIGAIDFANHKLTFDFTTATDDEGVIGDYTAGINEAIPDQVPTYTSVTDGDWTDVGTWTPAVPAGGPRGAMVVINHNVSVPVDYISSYRTTINDVGIVTIPGTEGHRLGNVFGEGTLYLETGSLPAGDYTEFLSSTGGTIEFGGNSLDYPVLSGITTVNNIKFSGSGNRDLPNSNLTILGDLTLEQSGGALTVDNKSDETLYVRGDITFNSGSFDFGQGNNASVVLNGTQRQRILGTGSFTGSNGFYNVIIDNSNGVELETDVEVQRVLSLTNGNINTESVSANLTLTYSEASALQGGDVNSFIEGPISKFINYNESFEFPVGRVGRYGKIKLVEAKKSGAAGSAMWTATYFNTNPTNAGYDVSNVDGDVAYVSQNEYWTVVSNDNGSTAKLTLTWDDASGVIPDDDFRVVEWKDLSPSAWQEISITGKTGNASAGSISTSNALAFNEFSEGNVITFGSILIPTFDWLGDESGDESNWFNPGNWGTGTVPGAGTDITIGSVSNPPVVDNSGIAQVNNLTINSGIKLTLRPGARMTINGDVVCDDDAIVIENSVDEPVSLIHYGTITNGSGTDREVQVDWTYSNNRYYYIGHSTDYAYANYDTPTVNPFNLYSYPGAWSKITSLTGSENKLTGYAVKFGEATDVTISHSGRLNNGTYLYTLSGNNLLANPYQSYIDVESSGFNPPSEADVTIYTSTNASGVLEYAAYNWDSKVGVNGGTRYIAPGQGFWVVGNSSTEFTMTPAARTHSFDSGNGMLKSVSQQPQNILRLKLFNEGMSDEIAMVFREDGDMELSKSDSKKRMGSGPGLPNLFSLKGGSKVAIGVYPNTDNIGSIPLGYTFAEEKELTIKATNIRDFNEADKVYLVDKFEDIVVDLTEDSEYHFVASGTEESDRFELRFEVGITTDIDEEQQTVSNSNVMIFVVKKKATVRVSEELLRGAKKIIEVYDLLGQLVAQHELNNAETKFDLPEANTMYIIKVSIDKSSYQEKVIAQM